MDDLDPYLLRAFLMVADTGTVSGAASAINRTQAAVSMQIRRLEQQLGSELFLRSSKGLKLTESGLILLPYAREIVTLGKEVRERLKGRQLKQRIRLGVVEDFALTSLVDVLDEFRIRDPEVAIDIIVDSNKRLVSIFNSGNIDILICDSSLMHRVAMHRWPESLMWVVRKDFMINMREALPIIMFDTECPWRGPAILALSNMSKPWSLVCEASTLIAMTTAIKAGIGIGILTSGTIFEGCLALDANGDLPKPVPIEIGLYAREASQRAVRHLANFIAGQALLSPPGVL